MFPRWQRHRNTLVEFSIFRCTAGLSVPLNTVIIPSSNGVYEIISCACSTAVCYYLPLETWSHIKHFPWQLLAMGFTKYLLYIGKGFRFDFISRLSLGYCGKCGPCANRSLFMFARKFRGCILIKIILFAWTADFCEWVLR